MHVHATKALLRGRLIVKEIGFVDFIVSSSRLIVKETIGFVDPIVSRGRLIVKEFPFVAINFLYLSKYLSLHLASLYSSFDMAYLG